MKVNVDFIPTISDIVSDDKGVTVLVEKLNVTFSRLNEILRSLGTAVNTIEFGDGVTADNVLGSWIPVEFSATPGEELTAAHTLQKIPHAIIGTKLDRSGHIYFSSVATSSNLYLKSDTASLSGTILVT